MGVTDVISEVTKGLKDSPVSLALITINVIYLAAGLWFLTKISERSETRDKLIIELAQRDCTPAQMRLQSGEDAPYDINKDAAKN